MTERLANSLIDILVVVGLDDNTGLKPTLNKNGYSTTGHDSASLFNTPFESQVLAAISSNIASFPFSPSSETKPYPPIAKKIVFDSKNYISSKSVPHVRADKVLSSSPNTKLSLSERLKQDALSLTRTFSKKASFSPVDFVRHNDVQKVTVVKPNSLPVPSEVINSLPTFCFPDNAYAFPSCPSKSILYLVLTDISGNKSYAACLTFFRPFIAEKSDEGSFWKCTEWTKKTEPSLEDGEQYAFLPTCLALISKFPYFTIMKDCLSRLVEQLECSYDDISQIIKDFTLQLTMTPAPPAGPLILEFELNGCLFTLYPPDHPAQSVIDLPLNIIFELLNIDNVLTVLSCILSEQRIVFISSSYPLLTLVMQGFLSLIEPLKWEYPYVPVLPSQLLDMLEAPGTFMMGCHVSHLTQINEVSGLVTVNLDSGIIQHCPSISINPLPDQASDHLNKQLRSLSPYFDVYSLDSPSAFNYSDMKSMQNKFQKNYNRKLHSFFLEFMVKILRNVLNFLDFEKEKFCKEGFLNSLNEQSTPFYDKLLKTDLFSRFVKSRLKKIKDSWFECEERTRNSVLKQISNSNRNSIVQQFSFDSSKKEFTTLRLPNFVPSLHYVFYDKCLQELSTRLKACKSSGIRASYLYLQGMFYAANNKPLESLDSFLSLHSCDNRIFPKTIISTIVASLTPKQKEALDQTLLYRKCEVLNSLKVPTIPKNVTIDFDKIPSTNIDKAKFIELAKSLEISPEYEIADRLFDALTLSKSCVLDPLSFEIFYENWKDLELVHQENKVPKKANLDLEESVLKISSMVKCDCGTGRLCLTQKRLFFILEATHAIINIGRLRDLISVEKCLCQTILKRTVSSVKLTFLGDKSMMFSLKDSCDLWIILIHEMAAGKSISEEMRDLLIIKHAAKNVLLTDAIVRSGEDSVTMHHSGIETAARIMCSYTRKVNEGSHLLHKNTKEMLIHKVHPNWSTEERSSVEVLLYTAGNRSESCLDGVGPKLWCGLGNGKLQIFNASTWKIEQQSFQAKDRIVALLSIRNQYVWAGSLDSMIYVFCMVTKCCNITLMEHKGMIADLTSTPDEKYVFSASIDGQIIKWDVDSLTVVFQHSIKQSMLLKSIQFFDDLLYICSKNEFFAINAKEVNMSIVKKLDYSKDGKVVTFGTFVHTPRKIWIGCGDRGEILVCSCENSDTIKVERVLKVPSSGISKLLYVNGKVWAGSKGGNIYIFDNESQLNLRKLEAHEDCVRSLCSTDHEIYVMSGSASKDGKICLWKADIKESLSDE